MVFVDRIKAYTTTGGIVYCYLKDGTELWHTPPQGGLTIASTIDGWTGEPNRSFVLLYRRACGPPVLLDGQGRCKLAESSEPFAWIIRRGPGARTLDHAMRRRAESLGAVIVTKSRLPREQARVVASGATAVDGVAMERTFKTPSASRVDVLFDTALIPGGYAYLFIQEGEGTLGVAAVSAYRELEPMLDVAQERFQSR